MTEGIQNEYKQILFRSQSLIPISLYPSRKHKSLGYPEFRASNLWSSRISQHFRNWFLLIFRVSRTFSMASNGGVHVSAFLDSFPSVRVWMAESMAGLIGSKARKRYRSMEFLRWLFHCQIIDVFCYCHFVYYLHEITFKSFSLEAREDQDLESNWRISITVKSERFQEEMGFLVLA